jgi:hypothetical protein
MHGGTVGVSSTAKLAVNGAPVLLAASVAGKTVAGCPVTDDPNTSTKHCTSVASVLSGPATRLTVGGKPVVLDTLTGTTDGTPPPTGAALGPASANQAKLQAI